MIETDGIFDWETNGINNGFRYPHQIAIIDNDNEARLEIKNFRIPHYELPSPKVFGVIVERSGKSGNRG